MNNPSGANEELSAVLVVGGGETAAVTAANLAKSRPVILVHDGEAPGIEGASAYNGYRVAKLSGTAGQFFVSLANVSDNQAELLSIKVGEIVLALETESAIDPALQLPVAREVIPVNEFTLALEENWHNKTVAFLVGEEFLSRYSTAKALDLAIMLRKNGARVEFLYQEMQVAGPGLERSYALARKLGVGFNRFSVSPEIHVNILGVVLNYRDATLPEPELTHLLADYLVAGIQESPSAQTKQLAEVMGLELGPEGFFRAANGLNPCISNRAGIYLVGSCHHPIYGVDLESEVQVVKAKLDQVSGKGLADKATLIIGGGTAGMAASLELAGHGIQVYLVEKSEGLGGKALNYCCKAAPDCQQCSACVPYKLKNLVESHPGIKVLLQSEIKEIHTEGSKYRATIRFRNGSRGVDLGAETFVTVSTVIVSSGFELYQAGLPEGFGYGKHKNVITALELEKTLKEHGNLEPFGSNIKKIGFIQCVGSRDVRAGNNYCSGVCCMSCAQLAKLIANLLPEAEVDVFYIDRQMFGENYRGYTQQLATSRIDYIREIPGFIYRYPYDYLSVKHAGVNGVKESQYDLIVLAQAMLPGTGLNTLAEALGLTVNQDGFFNPSGGPGVFACGCCTGPMNIPQTIKHSQAVSGRVSEYLGR
ncbi:MAG TPA: FAD-dependent oxidoreductase [Verrucomicrobiae bacterium]|nr:FAD-dependent oxidoreductase [Verrucomicrobiae bacterium]